MDALDVGVAAADNGFDQFLSAVALRLLGHHAHPVGMLVDEGIAFGLRLFFGFRSRVLQKILHGAGIPEAMHGHEQSDTQPVKRAAPDLQNVAQAGRVGVLFAFQKKLDGVERFDRVAFAKGVEQRPGGLFAFDRADFPGVLFCDGLIRTAAVGDELVQFGGDAVGARAQGLDEKGNDFGGKTHAAFRGGLANDRAHFAFPVAVGDVGFVEQDNFALIAAELVQAFAAVDSRPGQNHGGTRRQPLFQGLAKLSKGGGLGGFCGLRTFLVEAAEISQPDNFSLG